MNAFDNKLLNTEPNQKLLDKKNKIIDALIQNCAEAELTIFETESLLLIAKNRIQQLTWEAKIGSIQNKP